MRPKEQFYLEANHNVCDFGFAVDVVVFLLVGENRQDKVSGFTLTLPDQKAAGFAFFCEEFLCISPSEVTMVPPGD